MKKIFLITSSCILFSTLLVAQSVGINNNTPHSSAILDVKSSTKGMLIPRTSSTSRLAIIDPAKGLMLYDTTTSSFWFYNGATWLEASHSRNTWGTTGNAGTDTAVNFLGTTDNQPFRLRLNNLWAGELNHINRNYFIGDSTGSNNSTGIQNTGFGSKALYKNTSGSWNTAAGSEALYSNTSGSYNSAFGFSSLISNTTGGGNTAIGLRTLYYNTTGSFNTATGGGALEYNNTGQFNTANGVEALYINTTGHYNTANGAQALYYNSTGQYNTANGYRALALNNTGQYNTANGAQALYYNTSGSYNTAIGVSALYNVKSKENTAVGAYTLYYDTSSTSVNTAVGYASQHLNRNGSLNTSLGRNALYVNGSGNNNTAIGDSALYWGIGDFNIAVGNQALVNLNSGSSNIALGYKSGNHPGSPNVVNTISIGNDGILNGANNQAFFGNLSTVWNGGNKTWSTYSDARMKNNIKEDVKGLDFITRLKPVTYYRSISAITKITGNKEANDFHVKYDVEKIKETGFLAQDVEQAAKAAGYDFSGITVPQNSNQLYTLSYELFVVPLVKAVQEQQSIIEDMKKEIEELKKLIKVSK